MPINRQYEVDWTTPDFVEGEDPPGAIKKLDENQKQIFEEASKIRTHYAGDTPPSNPDVNQIWLDTSSNPPVLKRWDGAEWSSIKVSEASHSDSADSSSTADNADKVDGYDAASTPAAGKLLPLDDNAKFPNDVLYTGSGNGLDADKVDGYDASQTPEANKIPVADENGKIDDAWISASTTPAANAIPKADENGKLASGWMEFTASLQQNGYQKLPSGLIIQWGYVESAEYVYNVDVTFPITFPNTCLCAFVTPITEHPPDNQLSVKNITTSGMTIDTQERDCYWLAIGY